MSAVTAHIVEVGPRDGFQMESAFIPTELKIEVINLLSAAGIRKVEATSFVSPRVIPQMRDAEEVMRGIQRLPGTQYTALVPNTKGAKRAISAGASGLRIVICLSETYNRRNVGCSVSDSVANSQEVFELAKAHDVVGEAILALAFGCPLEGPIADSKVIDVAGELIGMGFRELSIADSIGVANPRGVKRLLRKLTEEFPKVRYSLHLHDTRGLALANVLAALEEGIDTFDSAFGGLGGCPVVAGGSGNVATEDLVNMLEEMDIRTGIDLDRVMSASRRLQGFLSHPFPSRILACGTRKQLFGRTIGQATTVIPDRQ